MPGTLFVVATPIGNLEDITLRALRVLREAAVIAAEDTRRTAHLLARHGITTPTTSLHAHNEGRKTPALLDRLQAGESVALVSDAGTPTISDPGAALVRAARAAGIRIEPIPGPNAAVTALSASGLLTDSFSFFGFPPTRSKDRKLWFSEIRRVGGVAIFYEAPHRLQRTLTELEEAVGDRHVLVARELTKTHEQLVEGPISSISGRLASDRGEFTVVVDVGPPLQDSPNIGEMPEIDAAGPRAAIKAWASSLGIPANDLYRAVEELKKLGRTTT